MGTEFIHLLLAYLAMGVVWREDAFKYECMANFMCFVQDIQPIGWILPFRSVGKATLFLLLLWAMSQQGECGLCVYG